MRLKKLILKNFLSFPFLEFDFPNKPLQIQGLNLTEPMQGTSGTGKTGIVTAIEYCITGTNSRGVRDLDLIMFGKNQAMTELFISCDVRKEVLRIKWEINKKDSNKIELKKQIYGSDDWIDIGFSGVADGKKKVDEWIGISKDDLFNYFLISKKRFTSFFASPNKEKVDLINRFSDASIIDGIEKVDTKELEEEKKEIERELNKIDGAIEQINEQKQRELNRDFESELNEKIGELKEKAAEKESDIKTLESNKVSIDNSNNELKVSIQNAKSNIDSENQYKAGTELKIKDITSTIESVQNELKEAKNMVSEYVLTNWESKRNEFNAGLKEDESKLDKQKADLQKIEAKEAQLLTLISQIGAKLEGSITCPNCEHEFLLNEDIDELKERQEKAKNLKPLIKSNKENIQKTISLLKLDIDGLQKCVSDINKEEQKENQGKQKLIEAANKVEEKLKEWEKKAENLNRQSKNHDLKVKSLLQDIDKSKNDIESNKEKITFIESRIEGLKSDIQNIEEQINSLKVGDNKKVLEGFETDLQKLDVEKRAYQKDLTKTESKIFEKNQWSNNFKQFRMFIANQSLEVIQYHNNRFLEEIGSDMRIKIEGFRFRADGTVKEEITAKIIREHERTFDSFSGGEKSILLFASILANRYMINETHPYGGLDFGVIDEVLEGASASILGRIIEAAKKLKVIMMLITHVTDEEANSDRILVIRENGLSRIEK